MNDTTNDAAKKKVAEEREAREKAQGEQREKMAKAKPTPTQEENDIAASGGHISEHEDDGSGPDPNATRAVEAKPGGGYATRSLHRGGHPAAKE